MLYVLCTGNMRGGRQHYRADDSSMKILVEADLSVRVEAGATRTGTGFNVYIHTSKPLQERVDLLSTL